MQNMKANLLRAAFPVYLVAIWLLAISTLPAHALGEIQVALLKTTTSEFTNVKVFNRTPTHLSFAHATGTAVIKLADIAPESLAAIERAQAGLPEPAGDEPAAALTETTDAKPVAGFTWAALKKFLPEKLSPDALAAGVTRAMIWWALAAFALMWLAYAYCCSLICQKAGHPGGLMVWIPLFQFIPMFRAAGMSGWWFIALFIPLLNIIGQVLWCVKISQARGKGFFTAVLLILPVTNLLAFLYLAFSNGHTREDDAFVPVRPPHALAVN
jgi:hypothetical protein